MQINDIYCYILICLSGIEKIELSVSLKEKSICLLFGFLYRI